MASMMSPQRRLMLPSTVIKDETKDSKHELTLRLKAGGCRRHLVHVQRRWRHPISAAMSGGSYHCRI